MMRALNNFLGWTNPAPDASPVRAAVNSETINIAADTLEGHWRRIREGRVFWGDMQGVLLDLDTRIKAIEAAILQQKQ